VTIAIPMSFALNACRSGADEHLPKQVTVHGKLKSEKRASFKPDLCFIDVAFRLVPILRRRNPYGMRSHAGALERETFKL